MTRFEAYGGFPTDRRIFVLAEPGPVRVRPFRPPPPVPPATPPCNDPTPACVVAPVVSIIEPGPSWAREQLLTALQQHGDWMQVRHLSQQTGVAELSACHLLERAWRAGLVLRRHRAFSPREQRQFKWKGAP